MTPHVTQRATQRVTQPGHRSANLGVTPRVTQRMTQRVKQSETQSYNKKKIAEIKFKEQVISNILITICLITFVGSLLSVRPFIKNMTSEIKFTHVAKEYKTDFKKNKENPRITITKQINNRKIPLSGSNANE